MIKAEVIKLWMQAHYNIIVDKIETLPGYDDINFLIQEQHTQDKYIFKLADPTLETAVKVQCAVLQYLEAEEELSTPVVKKTLEKEYLFTAHDEGREYLCRLLSYLEGEMLGSLSTFSTSLIKNFGSFLGNLNAILLEYEGPVPAERAFIWNIKYTSLCRGYYDYIKDHEMNRLVRYFVLQFEEKLKPELHSLRRSIIHNDAHTWNVLKNNEDISGIIDFGDMAFTHTIFELAIALTYLTIDADNIMDTASIFVEAYHSAFPVGEKELELLYYMITARLAISLSMSSYKLTTEPNNIYAQQGRQMNWKYLREWHKISPLYFENKMRHACGFKPRRALDLTSQLIKRNHFISKALSLSYDEPIAMHSASMQYMYDFAGNTYLDCVNNVCHVGHCHPKVVEAGQRQMAILNTNTRYIYENLADYAERLMATFPSSLNKVFFVNSGSAATDLAYRLSKAYTNQSGFVVLEGAYHGITNAAIDLSPYKFDGEGGRGCKSTVHKLSLPDAYREKLNTDDCVKNYITELEEILRVHNIAGFIAESILGCGGQIVLPEHFLKTVYSGIRRQGGLCIADEVQVGFGRTGSHFWAFELYDVVPDIVILGKPMGNGHPIGAVVTTQAVCQAFENGMEFFSSFGGNPVSCAIGKSVLEVIEEEQLQDHALNLGHYILEQWIRLKTKFNCIGDVRGRGLFLGMEIVKDKVSKKANASKAKLIIEEMKKRHILLSTDGPSNNVIKFKPPMIFTKENADHVYEAFIDVLS